MRYRAIVADPAWSYDDKLKMSDTPRSADANYRTMSVDAIKAFLIDTPASVIHGDLSLAADLSPQASATFRLADLIADVAFLWLWVTNPFLLDGTGAAVCRAWGFEPKQLVTWIKGDLRVEGLAGAGSLGQAMNARAVVRGPLGLGHYTRGATEHMILATRGAATKFVLRPKNVPNYFIAPAEGHSVKPQKAYDDVITKVTPGPYLDIFARKRRPGFDAIGDELEVAA